MKVMILDDETLAREVLKYCIPWEKKKLTLAYEGDNAADALEYLREHPVDIILTDITMPDMDGLVFAEKVKHSFPETDIIIITGYDEFEYARRGIRLGISDFLLKPVDDEELCLAIEKILMKKARSKANLPESISTVKREGGITEKVLEYIEDRYGDQELSLTSLASHFHVNASYLSRLFKQHTGVNLSDYIFELRMKKALHELEKADITICELAERVGFSDEDYFGRCFKKYTGMSFSTYKKQLRHL